MKFLEEIKRNKELAKAFEEFVRGRVIPELYNARHWDDEFTKRHAKLCESALRRVLLDLDEKEKDNTIVNRFD